MSGWEVRFSNSRKTPYFYNAQTQQSTWEPPAGMSEAEIHALPGAKYLTGGGDAGQVRASHILAKHAGSRRPSSWKQVSRGSRQGVSVAVARPTGTYALVSAADSRCRGEDRLTYPGPDYSLAS